MKKISFLLALLLSVTLAFAGCGNDAKTPSGNEPEKPGPTDPGTPDNPSKPGEEDDVVIIDFGDKNNPTFSFTEDGALVEMTRKKQDTVNRLSATDDFGRSFDYIDGYKTDKDRYVGLFYFAWLGQHGGEMSGVYDITKLLDEDPSALWNTAGTTSSPVGKYHHWGEPLYGYYNSLDPWVIRKQVELFTMAGIDFLCFDVTNGAFYIEVVQKVLDTLQQYYDEGWNVPKFVFYTNSNSADVVRKLYAGNSAEHNELAKTGIYKPGKYRDLWFCPDGKPKIVAISNPNSTNNETPGITAADYLLSADASIVTDPVKRALNAECLAFFDIWESTWPNNVQYENGLPWMDWSTNPDGTKADQKMLGDAMNVSIAQHNLIPFSKALRDESAAANMWGRGYSKKTGADHSDDAINSGVNFEEEWEVAHRLDPKFAFVTGWNEWIALKSVNPAFGGVFFVDTVNREYSRDIEMMKDGYADNAYLQLMRNVRTYKGKSGTQAAGNGKTIDIKQGLTQWSDVNGIFDSFTGAIHRNFLNFSGTKMLKDTSLRNDIASVRVTSDSENIYFLVECAADIVKAPEENNFMNLLIDVEGQSNDNAFYGYNYVINRKSSYTGQCSVEKIGVNDDYELTYTVKDKAAFTANGKYMQFAVPKSALGITGGYTIRFKVADNVTEPENIQSYYITGDCAPVGRLNFTYKGV